LDLRPAAAETTGCADNADRLFHVLKLTTGNTPAIGEMHPIHLGPHNVIGDLLHRLDLHSDVKPIDDVRYRLGQCLWKPASGSPRHLKES
jgi:hypothetical protein